MTNAKKGLAFLLSFLLLVTVLPVPAVVFAEPAATEGSCGDGVTWRLEENAAYTGWYSEAEGVIVMVAEPADPENPDPGIWHETHYTLYIEGEGAMDDYDEDAGIVVPWEDARWDISQVEVAEGVTHIGDGAFQHCDNLRVVSLPEGLESIGAFAFECCMRFVGEDDVRTPVGSLQEIGIPETVTYIGRQAFANNKDFCGAAYPGEPEDLAAICLAGDGFAEDWSVAQRLREVFDNTYWFDKWFGSNYLQGVCGDGLSWQLVLNNDWSGWYSEETNERIEEPEDPGESNARYETYYTLKITYDGYGDGVMDNYTYSEEFTDPMPWEELRWNIVRVEVGEGVTTVGDSAFRWSNNLREVSLPDSLERIGEFAFENCVRGDGDGDDWYPISGLSEVVIPENVVQIGSCAFANNQYLEDVVFEGAPAQAVCMVEDDFAAGWTVVQRVHEVFDGAPWFNTWFAEYGMSGICGEDVSWRLVENEDSFWAYDETGERVENEEDYNKPGTHYEPLYTLFIEYTGEPGGTGAMEDYCYDDDFTFPQPWEYDSYRITRLDVDENVTVIGANAFRWLSGLRAVTLHEGLESINEFAFESCCFGWDNGDGWEPIASLAEIAIPSTVTYIGREAFSHNVSMEAVAFDGDLADVCLAGDDFADGWDAPRRVREVFNGTPWYDNWISENYMSGSCGDNITWELTENDASGWYYDETDERVENEEDYNKPYTHYNSYYTLTLTGTGEMYDYCYDDENRTPQPWDFISGEITVLNIGEGVTSIGNEAFRWCGGLRTVNLPESLTHIGERAFESCCDGQDDGEGWYPIDSLAEITIPDGVTYIGSGAFANNISLSTIRFGGDLADVCLAGDGYADGWSGVQRVREVFDGTPWYDNWLWENYMSGSCGDNITWELAENEDSGWFYDETGERVENEEDYDKPYTHYESYYTLTLTGTGEMYDYCYDEENRNPQPWDFVSGEITEVYVDDGVTSIGNEAFRWCGLLRDVRLPESLTYIGERAFESCCDGQDDGEGWYPIDSLAEITIPDRVTYIGSGAFGNNISLSTICFGGDLEEVCLAGDDYAEDWSPAQRVREVFDNTPWFEDHYFSGSCGENLSWSLAVNDDTGWYYEETGERVENEEDYNKPYTHYVSYYTLTLTGTGRMYDYCYDDENRTLQPWDFVSGEITELYVDDGVTSIGNEAFRWCSLLRDVRLPESLTHIGERAFESCCDGQDDGEGWYPIDSLAFISIPDGVTYIGRYAFANNISLSSISFGGNMEEVCLAGDDYAADWSGAKRVREVLDGTPWYENWFEKNHMSGACGDGVTWQLTVNDEYSGWFYDETGERVEDPADEGQPGTWYETYYTLTISGAGEMKDFLYTEDECDPQPWELSNEQIVCVDVFEGVTHIGDFAFQHFHELHSVSLPDSLESIGTFAFEDCKRCEGDGPDWHVAYGLSEITIPADVTYIAGRAFANNEMLETVNFEGNIEEICLAGEGGEVAEWGGVRRVQEVFDNTPWFDAWYAANGMAGDCGENVHWRLEKNNEDSYWIYNDTWEVVTNEEDIGKGNTHEEVRYTLYIEGTGVTDDYRLDGDARIFRPWELSRYQISRVSVGEGVTGIGKDVFRGHENLQHVSLPETLESIGSFAFENCKRCEGEGEEWHVASCLSEITIPAGVSYIAGGAFVNNELLASVNYEGNIEDICLAGEAGIEDWSAARRVREVFSNTQWYADHYMAGSCGEHLTWRMEVNEERTGWYYEETDEMVADPADFGAPGTYHKTLYTVYINGTGAMDDYDYDDEYGLRPPWAEERWGICRVEVSEGVTHIGSHAFRWCDNLREIDLPDSLESIGELAFESCKFGRGMDEEWHPVAGLGEVTIPAGVELIGRLAFGHNDFLTDVVFDGDFIAVCLADNEDAQNWFEFDRVREVFDGAPWYDDWFEENYMNGVCGDDATWQLIDTGDGIWVWYDGRPVEDENDYDAEGTFFATYYRLKISGEGDLWANIVEGHPGLSYFSINITELVIEDGITSIGTGDFRNLDNLTLVTLPTTLTSIGEEAFDGCPRLGDGDVYYDYPGDINEWNAIDIADGNDPLLAAQLHVHEHTAAQPVTENPVAPTCTVPGSYDTVVYCEDCGKELSRTPGSENALGHLWGDWTKISDTQHTRVCERDNSHVETANHTWNAGVVTKAATCTAAGVKTYTCTVCNATKTESINATGHNYGAWTKLNDTQHQRVCANDNSHVEKANHTWNAGVVTTAATEEHEGVKTFTCTVCGATKTEQIPQLPVEVKDDASGITVTYDPGTYEKKITIKVVETDPPADALPAEYEKTYSVDISTFIGDKEVEPNAPVTVTVPVPEGFNVNTLAVYHIKDDGTVEKVAFTVKDGKISFTALGFSVYVVADTSTEIEKPAFTYGDVDGNGKIEAADARLALRIAVGLEPEMGKGTREFNAANVSEVAKGEVNAADARLILRKAVGFEDEEFGV